MNVSDVINETIDEAYEWLEMSDDPSNYLMGLLANKIIKLKDQIEYLEKRLENADRKTRT